MVTVGYNPSTGKALMGTGGALCIGCCGGGVTWHTGTGCFSGLRWYASDGVDLILDVGNILRVPLQSEPPSLLSRVNLVGFEEYDGTYDNWFWDADEGQLCVPYDGDYYEVTASSADYIYFSTPKYYHIDLISVPTEYCCDLGAAYQHSWNFPDISGTHKIQGPTGASAPYSTCSYGSIDALGYEYYSGSGPTKFDYETVYKDGTDCSDGTAVNQRQGNVGAKILITLVPSMTTPKYTIEVGVYNSTQHTYKLIDASASNVFGLPIGEIELPNILTPPCEGSITALFQLQGPSNYPYWNRYQTFFTGDIVNYRGGSGELYIATDNSYQIEPTEHASWEDYWSEVIPT